jgi:tetratricopeptide (TPR) repeat protein
VYPGKINKEKGKVLEKKKKETVTSVDLSWKEPAKKHSNIPQPPPTSINKEQNEDRLEKAKKAESVQKDYGIRKKRAAVTERKKEDNDDDLIADKYKKLWVLLKSGKPYGVLKEIQRYKPEDIESLASHHFIFGKANESLKNYMDAVKHFRLAYIYSVKSKLKELALFKRAEMHLNLRLFYEARADYIVFIRDFPSSEYIEEAHLKLAKTLKALGLLNEAVGHFEKAGHVPQALFGRANALQRLEKVEEAHEAYGNALIADKTYPEKSPETYFLIGENMRMLGETEGAKKHLSITRYGPFKDEAIISLGLIALEESNTEAAAEKFKMASESKDKKIKVQALFNLSKVFFKEGKLKESIAVLEEIRHDHINSSMYKDTLLELSRLYKKDGRMNDSVSLLKELVYGKEPPAGTFDEIKKTLLEASEKTGDKNSEDIEFAELWNEVGQWMFDKSREDFLLGIARKLRYEGESFLKVSSWLVENASDKTRSEAALNLARYHIGAGNIDISRKYLEVAMNSKELKDDVLKIEAKIHRFKGEQKSAFNRLLQVKKFEKDDFKLLGNLVSDLKKSEPAEVAGAVDFYEKKLNEYGGDAEDYIRLADSMFENNKKSEALKYYKIAYEKKPEDEWTLYRLGRDAGKEESEEMFSRLQKGNTLLSGLAKTKLMEINLMNRVEEVY